MNIKKLKRIFILIIIALIITITIPILINKVKDYNSRPALSDTNEKEYTYDFGKVINLEDENGPSEAEIRNTNDPSLGIVSSYYDDIPIDYVLDDVAILSTYEGKVIVSSRWLDKGYASYIDQPEFGTLEKVIIKDLEFSAKYTGVSIDDISNYIKKLEEKGFTDVIQDKKDKKEDTYRYTVKDKDRRTVFLDYSKSVLEIIVY